MKDYYTLFEARGEIKKVDPKPPEALVAALNKMKR